MTVKKELCCDHCGAEITVQPPDDQHTVLALEAGTKSIQSKVQCDQCKMENIRYWHAAAGPVVMPR
ncbi:MAG: hypothetical protein ABSD99_12425 [Candidatus Bathyarchaeia archaeon]